MFWQALLLLALSDPSELVAQEATRAMFGALPPRATTATALRGGARWEEEQSGVECGPGLLPSRMGRGVGGCGTARRDVGKPRPSAVAKRPLVDTTTPGP